MNSPHLYSIRKGRLPAKHPLHVSMGCISVWGLGGDFPATVSVFVEGKKDDSRTGGCTGLSVGPCLCPLPWHRYGHGGGGSCSVTRGRRGWPTSQSTKTDSWTERNQGGSAWWICEHSGSTLPRSASAGLTCHRIICLLLHFFIYPYFHH